MCVGATWMERVEAGCLSLPRNSAILVFSFPLGSSALGLSPRACCSLSPLPFPILRLPSLPSGSFRDPGLRARDSGVSSSSFLLFPPTLGLKGPTGPLKALSLRCPWKSVPLFVLFCGWWGCGAQERERWCVERQVLRVILIPMDSAQRAKDANLNKSRSRYPLCVGDFCAP